MSNVDRITQLREASNVERSHTIPHHGSYTVGKHSYDMVMALLVLNPTASPALIQAVLVHDLGERWTGDIPSPAKVQMGGEISRRIQQLEERALAHLGFSIELTPDERLWLRAMDGVELLLWSKDQLAMGNLNVQPMVHEIVKYLNGIRLPQPVIDFLKGHRWERFPNFLP